MNDEKEIPWFLSDDDYYLYTKDSDVLCSILEDNGVINPLTAYYFILRSRTEYDTPNCSFCKIQDRHYPIYDKYYDKDMCERWTCKKCGKHFSITSGTYIDNLKLSFSELYRFCFLVGDLKITNSYVIAKDLKISQKSSWKLLNKLRQARKETTERKFKNGQEVLVFSHRFEVCDVLCKFRVVI